MRFPGDLLGIAFNVDEDEIGVILLGDYQDLHAGDEVERTGRVMDVAVGDGLLGRVIDPLGKPLDGKGPVAADQRLPVERPAPPIMDRAPVVVPLQTGLKVVDALIPIGRGQRELILGDRQTGKTAIAIDTILNQRGQNVICVYCAIGQRASAVAKVVANLREKGAMDYTVVVVAEGNDAPGLVYITPYAATSIAEYFMEKGRDVLIVYDDLTHHARAYRELSLLLRRPPGPRSIPRRHLLYSFADAGTGDASEQGTRRWFSHRASHHRNRRAGYLRLHPNQSHLHHRRSDLPFAHVVRIGSPAGGRCRQIRFASGRSGAASRLSRSRRHLKLAYSQFEELETFAKFGTRLDESTRKIIDHGQRIRACLKQPESQPVSMVEQISVLLALTAGLFDPVPLEKVKDAERALQKAAAEIPADVAGRLTSADKLSDADRKAVLDVATRALAPFQPAPKSKPESEPKPDAAPRSTASPNPRPRLRHERHHGEFAPKNRWRRGS